MSTTQKFDEAVKSVNDLKHRPSDGDLLDLYGLFKQAKCGDVNTDKPNLIDIKGKAKWEAWNSRKGLSQEDAQLQYIAKAKSV